MSTKPPGMGEVFSLTMDGRRLSAAQGASLLQVARAAGISIPTLCDHPDLEPVGACRLCLVEVTHPDWGGWSGLMTACLYPAAPELEVSTRSEKVLQVRRGVLALLAARCPSSPEIQQMARKAGATTERLVVDPDADSCVLCGLCTRVCETFATSAISSANRGIRRKVGAPFDVPPADCVGCGACARVCPTAHIQDSRGPTSYAIWGREFPTAACAVIPGRCVGCGACEEACPFDVPRVALQKGGPRTARIPAGACRGCGVCVGACPTGAIVQQGDPLPMPGQVAPAAGEPGKVTAVACARCAGTLVGSRALPSRAMLSEVPCAGKATALQLLRGVARGDGVLVLGRHESTCRLDGCEGAARDRVDRVARLLELLGLEPGRVRFGSPGSGLEATADWIRGAMEEVPAGRGASGEPPPWKGEGLWAGMELLTWLGQRSRAGVRAHDYLKERGLSPWRAGQGGWRLWAGDLPYLQLLGEELWRPGPLDRVLEYAAAVLLRLHGEQGGVVVGPCGVQAPGDAVTLAGLDDLLARRGRELPRPARVLKVACAGEAAELALIQALGHEAVVVGPDPLPAPGQPMGPGHRTDAEARLAAAEAAGAYALLVRGEAALASWSLITRDGAWRSSTIRPVTGAHLAAANLEVRP